MAERIERLKEFMDLWNPLQNQLGELSSKYAAAVEDPEKFIFKDTLKTVTDQLEELKKRAPGQYAYADDFTLPEYTSSDEAGAMGGKVHFLFNPETGDLKAFKPAYMQEIYEKGNKANGYKPIFSAQQQQELSKIGYTTYADTNAYGGVYDLFNGPTTVIGNQEVLNSAYPSKWQHLNPTYAPTGLFSVENNPIFNELPKSAQDYIKQILTGRNDVLAPGATASLKFQDVSKLLPNLKTSPVDLLEGGSPANFNPVTGANQLQLNANANSTEAEKKLLMDNQLQTLIDLGYNDMNNLL